MTYYEKVVRLLLKWYLGGRPKFDVDFRGSSYWFNTNPYPLADGYVGVYITSVDGVWELELMKMPHAHNEIESSFEYVKLKKTV